MHRERCRKDAESIYLNREPWTIIKAIGNLYAFSEEGCKRKIVKEREDLEDVVQVTPMPRMKECFGWTTISGATLGDLRRCGMAPPSL